MTKGMLSHGWFTLSQLGHARRGQWYEVGVRQETRTPSRKDRLRKTGKSKTLTVKAPKQGSLKATAGQPAHESTQGQ